jgi:uncharacterized membrane protein YheB (UPF0754 family)
MNWPGIVDDLRQNWLLYASMPIVAATIGYVTKLLAIRMMFEPIEFRGWKPPYLGWQGIVPRNAERMATIACDTMTARLLSPRDVFRRLDPHRVAREIEQPMLAAVEDITREVAAQYQPGLWQRLPDRVRDAIINRIKAESPDIVRRIMQDIQRNIDHIFDLKEMVVRSLLRDKALLNRIFQEAGRKEFQFIARSGLPFGFAIGCVQAVTWALTHSAWVMPLFGGFTGWFTDWLALKMIFHPKQPTRYLGLFEWQGLFLKRRREVAADYGALIAREVITPRNVLESVLRGPASDRLYELVLKHVQRAVDEQAGLARPLVVFAVGSQRYEEMKQVVAQKLMTRLPEAMKHVEEYAGDAMDLRNTLVTKMQELTPEEFEGLLRPAFQQDEWILIAVGAALGFLVGEMQVFVMLHAGH